MKKIQRKIVKFVIKLGMLIVFRVKIVGKENVPQEGAAIICPNHVSFFDPPVLVAFNKRHINMLAKIELTKNPILNWLKNVFDVFPVKRDGNDTEAIKHSLKVLKNGGLLGMYPEGTRNGMKKGVKPKNGAVVMAIKSGVPIIPVGMQGSFKPFTKVKANYGKPIYYDKTKINLQDRDLIDNLTKELMEEIVRLTNEKI